MEAEEIRRFFYAFFFTLSAQVVLEVTRPVFFPYVWRGISAKWGTNRPKTSDITRDNIEKRRQVNFIYLTVIKRILGMKCYDLQYL